MHPRWLSSALVAPCSRLARVQDSLPLRAHLCGRILIAVHFVQGLFCRINDELGRIITTWAFIQLLLPLIRRCMYLQKTLAHIDYGLDRRSGRSFIDNGPRALLSLDKNQLMAASYQTSCFCPATLFAGRKGSLRAAVEDIVRAL